MFASAYSACSTSALRKIENKVYTEYRVRAIDDIHGICEGSGVYWKPNLWEDNSICCLKLDLSIQRK